MRSPQERSAHARLAANYRWAREEDRMRATAAMRAASPASIEYWLAKVDPQGVLPYSERTRRAESEKTAYWQARAMKMRRAKAAKAEARRAERAA
ncbi:hypothetical protein ACIBG7_18810 [Nonomuraea sp. NPDC050328]|uniref:hypothetical protein n=1 Tax=Nonomuraea sp. NPDC050328 TaxID=3364361 RepID=UPI0037AD3DA7